MNCQRCDSERLLEIVAKCSDMCWHRFHPSGRERHDYVPTGVGIGGGDYVDMTYCRDCGQIQGTWPVGPVV